MTDVEKKKKKKILKIIYITLGAAAVAFIIFIMPYFSMAPQEDKDLMNSMNDSFSNLREKEWNEQMNKEKRDALIRDREFNKDKIALEQEMDRKYRIYFISAVALSTLLFTTLITTKRNIIAGKNKKTIKKNLVKIDSIKKKQNSKT